MVGRKGKHDEDDEEEDDTEDIEKFISKVTNKPVAANAGS